MKDSRFNCLQAHEHNEILCGMQSGACRVLLTLLIPKKVRMEILNLALVT